MRDTSEPVRPRMTMRVYRVAADGSVTADLGRVDVMGDRDLAPLVTARFPPCRCPQHREGPAERTSGPLR